MSVSRQSSELERSDWISLAAGLAALVAVAAVIWIGGPDQNRAQVPLALWIVIVACAAFLAHKTSPGHIGLEGTLLIGVYLAFGLRPAIWTTLLGTLISRVGRRVWDNLASAPRQPVARIVVSAAFHIALQISSLLAGVFAYRLVGSHGPLLQVQRENVPSLAALLAGYVVTNKLFLAASLTVQGLESVRDYIRRNWQTLVLFELTPLPFAVFVATTYGELGVMVFVGFCAYLAAMTVIIHQMERFRSQAEQRVRHLITLNSIGTAMRAGQDLPELLEAIHQQIGQLLDARNFYIALYAADADEVSFPLYYENGKRSHLKPRRAGNGLLGCIVQAHQPLLIRENVADAAAQLGLDELASHAESWLGVPILSDERTLGVIVVQSQTPRAYDHTHLKLLTTVASQAAIAIRNAQLYSTMRHRTTELAILNAASTAIGATLDLERVLGIIVTSLGPFIGCTKSALFLLNDAGDELHLAKSHGLGPTFIASSRKLKVGPGGRGQVAAQRRPRVAPDIAAAPGMEDFVSIAQAEDIRALAEVPLIAQNVIIGTLAVYFENPRPLTQAEMDLLQTFANQAAAAVNNARLYARTDQALARRVEELSALEEISRELAGTLDVARIADLIIELARQVTGAQAGNVVLLDETGAGGQVIVQRGYQPEKIEPFLREPLTRGIIGRVLRSGVLANVTDVRLDPDYVSTDPNVHSQLSVPIIRKGRVLGAMTLEGYPLAAFDAAAIAFTEQLANQAAVTIENAQLFSERAHQINALSQLHEASLALTGSLDFQQVLDRIATAAHRLTNADTVALHLYDSFADAFLLGATTGAPLPGDSVAGIRPQGMTRRAVQQRQPIFVGDTHTDPDANSRIIAVGVRSLICAPVISHDQVLGVLNVFSCQPHKFADADVHLVSALANQAAVAIENARLFQAVAEGRDKLHAILDSSREGVLMFDLAGRVAMANPSLERLLGISRAASEGRLLDELLDEPEFDFAIRLGSSPVELLALLDQLRQGQRQQETPVVYQLTRPSMRFIERSGTPVLDSSGKLVGWMITLRDVTEERELQRMRDDLTNMIIHDLRSPLSSILSGLYLLKEMLPAPSGYKMVSETLSATERSCLKLLDLVNSLLDISKMEAGHLEIASRPVNLALLVDGLLDRLAPLAQAEQVAVTSHVGPDCRVLADEEKLNRVLNNLVDNAIKFTPEGGQIIIDAVPLPGAEGFIRCEVRDTGPGIPPEHRERIFNRFSQIPGVSGRRRGTGLGLNFCKLVVEAHGGRIWVESEEGQGSTFYFTLPASVGQIPAHALIEGAPGLA